MRLGRRGFALFSFSVVAWALANPLTACGAGSPGSSAGSHGSEGSSAGDDGGKPAAEAGSDGQRATFVLSVPADAKVYFQDEPMSSTGTRRRYRSPALKAGKTFSYSIRVAVQRNGNLVSNTQQPRFHAGSRVEIAFDLADADRKLVAKQPAPSPSSSGPGTVRQFRPSVRASST